MEFVVVRVLEMIQNIPIKVTPHLPSTSHFPPLQPPTSHHILSFTPYAAGTVDTDMSSTSSHKGNTTTLRSGI